MRRILLYGCGKRFHSIKDALKQCEKRGQFIIIGICDKNLPEGKDIDGWPIIPKEKISEQSFDSILITSSRYEREIKEELLEYGIDRRVFNYGFCPSEWDTSLNGVSIFSNLCWGGIAAHTLGIECCSPTKDLWIVEHEFIAFLNNLDYYLSLDPVMSGWSGAHGQFDSAKYPLLAVGDITLHCNHDSDPDEAIEKWQRRKKKIHFDNMVAVLVTQHPKQEADFYGVERITKKYCLVPWESHFTHSVFIKKEEGKPWHESANATAFSNRTIDLSALLRGEDEVRKREYLNG